MDNKLPTTSPTRVAKPSGRRCRVSSWTGVVLLALTVCALRPIRQLFNKPASFAGSQQERIDDPWSTAFPGNDTVGTVQLSPCEGGVECGYIVVPKNYSHMDAGIVLIAVARHRSKAKMPRGHVMLNPGGPGVPGTMLVLGGVGWGLQTILGPQWSLLGFDPRGVGRTRPNVHCFPDAGAKALLYAHSPFTQGYDIPNSANLSDAVNLHSLTVQARQFRAIKAAQALACADNMNVDDLRYMGSTTIVRDMAFMTALLDGPNAKINYWGGSYGSLLGIYLVNMLPERAGFVSIDAVVNASQWAHQPSHKWTTPWTVDAEKAYDWFLKDCSTVGPELCPLTVHAGEPPADIKSRLEKFIVGLVSHPLPAVRDGNPGYVTSGLARAVLYQALTSPRGQPWIARDLASAIAGDGGPLLLRAGYPGHGDLERLGTTCADSPASPVSAGELAEEMIRALRVSRFGTSVIYSDPDGGCEFWPASGRTVERFVGPFNASLDYPMLIMSNSVDPITPLTNAVYTHQQMPESSILVIQDGLGHSVVLNMGLCALRAQQAYWAGVPPRNGTACPLGRIAFPVPDEADVEELGEEDRVLLEASRVLGDGLQSIRNLHWNIPT